MPPRKKKVDPLDAFDGFMNHNPPAIEVSSSDLDQLFEKIANAAVDRTAGEQKNIRWVGDNLPFVAGKSYAEIELVSERLEQSAPSPRGVWLLRQSLSPDGQAAFWKNTYPKIVDKPQDQSAADKVSDLFKADRPIHELCDELLKHEKDAFGPQGAAPDIDFDELMLGQG